MARRSIEIGRRPCIRRSPDKAREFVRGIQQLPTEHDSASDQQNRVHDLADPEEMRCAPSSKDASHNGQSLGFEKRRKLPTRFSRETRGNALQRFDDLVVCRQQRRVIQARQPGHGRRPHNQSAIRNALVHVETAQRTSDRLVSHLTPPCRQTPTHPRRRAPSAPARRASSSPRKTARASAAPCESKLRPQHERPIRFPYSGWQPA